MKIALTILAVMVVLVAVQAGKGKGKGKNGGFKGRGCNKNKLEKGCPSIATQDTGKGKGPMAKMSEECKTAITSARTEACGIYKADSTKVDEACKAMNNDAVKKCWDELKDKSGESKEEQGAAGNKTETARR